jgi:hypothetical protein
MDTVNVKLENVTIASDVLTKCWIGFIALGWPCNIRDCGAGRHTIEVRMPVGQSTSPQASAIFKTLGGARHV